MDCVLTHCAPTSIIKGLGPDYQPDRLTDFLESVRERCQFSRWFCGHYHLNRVINERFVIQWEQISKIENKNGNLIITPPDGSVPYANR